MTVAIRAAPRPYLETRRTECSQEEPKPERAALSLFSMNLTMQSSGNQLADLLRRMQPAGDQVLREKVTTCRAAAELRL